MSEQKSSTKVFVEKYHYASQREKIVILDEFVEYTGFRRNYAVRLLRSGTPPESNKSLHRMHSVFTILMLYYRLKSSGRFLISYSGNALFPLSRKLTRKGKQFNEFDVLLFPLDSMGVTASSIVC